MASGIFSQNTNLNFYGSTVIEDVHAVSSNDAYAIGAEIVDAAVVFHDSLTIRNVSAWADDSVNSAKAWTQCSSGTCGSKTAAAYAIGSYLNADVRINPDAKESAVVWIENDLTAGDDGKNHCKFRQCGFAFLWKRRDFPWRRQFRQHKADICSRCKLASIKNQYSSC